jgi:hypothetical protein
LTFRKRVKLDNEDDDTEGPDTGSNPETAAKELTEDQKAIKALISSAEGVGEDEEQIAAIPLPSSGMGNPTSLAEREIAAYKQDVLQLPDPAPLEAYERIPVSQFGAALLRGMGWKEGQAASRTRKGPVEPWIPTQRPQLLGIGAKEREVLDDGSKKKSSKSRQDAKKYMPLIKVDKVSFLLTGFGDELTSYTQDSGSSRDRSPDERYRERDRERERRDYDRNGRSERRRSKGRGYDSKEYRDRDGPRDDRDRKGDWRREMVRDDGRDRRRDDRERDRESHSDRHDDRSQRKGREGDQ